ncbi:MAG: EAL domain-containing protein [Colwellia sp.]|nr:EAL domain-containing protein [Colwellia sp.]
MSDSEIFIKGDEVFGIEELNVLFPFHFSFDQSLRIRQCGISLLKIEPKLVVGASLLEFFKIKNPRISMEYDEILRRAGALHNWLLNDSLNMRGQIMSVKDNNFLVFIGSPSITSAKQLNDLGLTANDFAQHDTTLDHLFMLQAQATSLSDSTRMVASLQRSAEEKTKLETLQADLSFELNIAYDLKVRFKGSGTILDIKASPALPITIDSQQFIGENVYSEIPYLGESLRDAITGMADNDEMIPFRFAVSSGRRARYFEARLARTPNQVYLLLANDVTEQHNLKLQLERRANFDSLTKLPNRSYFFERVSSIIRRTEHEPLLYTLMSIDLDNFKSINDSYGHSAGDFTLETISRLLLKNTRLEDVAARLGGDEFAIFTSGNMSKEEMLNIAKRICKAANELISFQNNEFRCGCSIGIAFSEKADLSLDLFRNQADLAMYHAKDMGKGTVAIYQEGMYEEHQKTLSLRDALSKAINDDQLTLAYQPVVDNKTGDIAGFEALARWHQPGEGDIPPDRFIQIAEDSGLMVTLGRTILRRAISTWAQLMKNNSNVNHWTLALNISAYQLYDHSLVRDLTQYLKQYDIDTSQIVLEITETALIRDIDQAISLIVDLKNMGYTIALDDFGTGFSSLNYLDQLPLNVLKIDRSFVMKIESEQDRAPLVESIIGIAKVMKLDVIAEGVETSIQQQLLSDMGCNFSQGYYYSKPVSESVMLNNGNPLDVTAILSN